MAASAHQSTCRAASAARGVDCCVAAAIAVVARHPRARLAARRARGCDMPAAAHSSDEQHVAGRPAPGLHARRDPRLEQERIAEQRQHRREVRQREQPVRARARKAPREPGLHERARRRQQEVRQADRRGQQAEDQPRRVLGRRAGFQPAPGMIGSSDEARRPAARCGAAPRAAARAVARSSPRRRSRRAARSGRTRGTSSRPPPSRRTTAGSAWR